MGKVLGAFRLLYFTMLLPVLAWRAFLNLQTVYFLIFQFFSGRGKPRITETAVIESVNTEARLYLRIYLCGLSWYHIHFQHSCFILVVKSKKSNLYRKPSILFFKGLISSVFAGRC
jgi:hypothetical protein